MLLKRAWGGLLGVVVPAMLLAAPLATAGCGGGAPGVITVHQKGAASIARSQVIQKLQEAGITGDMDIRIESDERTCSTEKVEVLVVGFFDYQGETHMFRANAAGSTIMAHSSTLIACREAAADAVVKGILRILQPEQ